MGERRDALPAYVRKDGYSAVTVDRTRGTDAIAATTYYPRPALVVLFIRTMIKAGAHVQVGTTAHRDTPHMYFNFD